LEGLFTFAVSKTPLKTNTSYWLMPGRA